MLVVASRVLTVNLFCSFFAEYSSRLQSLESLRLKASSIMNIDVCCSTTVYLCVIWCFTCNSVTHYHIRIRTVTLNYCRLPVYLHYLM